VGRAADVRHAGVIHLHDDRFSLVAEMQRCESKCIACHQTSDFVGFDITTDASAQAAKLTIAHFVSG
jgi:hypothetical protein